MRDRSAPLSSNGEAVVDDRARAMPLNNYLADRLEAWRALTRGRMWIFENLMLHATMSIPVPNLELLGEDLRAAQREGVDGYLFEAYLQGWNSFASDLWTLARLCWNTSLDPVVLERDYYRRLLGPEGGGIERFYADFRARQLVAVRRGGLYWMHCAPEAARKYMAALGALNDGALPPAGRAWRARQAAVVDTMEDLMHRGSAPNGSALLASRAPADVLAVARRALATGRAMDGVVLA